MDKIKHWDSEETLQEIKNSLAVDDDGMFTMLGRRIVITPQSTFGTMMKSAADFAGINAAKVFMRQAGIAVAEEYSKIIKELLKLEKEEAIVFYCETGGKRGWGFNVIEEINVDKGIFKGALYHSPFVTGFQEKINVPVCDYLVGAIEGMFKYFGAKGVRIVEKKCVAMGDDVCRFENV